LIDEKCQSEYENVILVNLCLSHNQPFNYAKLNISTTSTKYFYNIH